MKLLLRLLLRSGFVVFAALLVSACTSDEDVFSPAATVSGFSDVYSEDVYSVLLAEYQYHQQNYQQAKQLYSQLLLTHADAGVARRVTELAIKVDDYDQALIAAQQWKLLQPDSMDVNQFLVLLYQEKKDYVASAKILADLVKFYPDGQSKPLDIAVALLEQQKDESHAYHTFKYYLQHHLKTNDDLEKEMATYYLGLFAMRAELFDQMIQDTKEFAKIKNKDLQRKTALLRVKAFTALGQSEHALDALKKLITEAANPVTKQSYARIMASLGQAENAVTLLEQAYDKHPDKAELLLDMISISLGSKKYTKTLSFIDKLQAIKGQKDNAHYYRGLVFESQEKYAEALKAYSLVDKKSKNMLIYSRIVAVMAQVKGVDAALSFLHDMQKSHKKAELQSELYLLESETLRQEGRFKEALDVTKKAIKQSPSNLDVLYSQALLYEDLKEIKKSEETLQEILHLDSKNSAALNALGYMLSVHTTRFDEAYQYIKKAYELRPNDPAIIDSLGWVSYRKGDLQDAEHYLRLAYQKLQDPEVASHLVEVLSKQGQQEEATKLLKEMLKKHPENKQLIETQVFINHNNMK